jgi:hypothetical protein
MTLRGPILLWSSGIQWLRMCGAIPPLPQYVFMAWCLVKHRDFTCYLTRLQVNGCHFPDIILLLSFSRLVIEPRTLRILTVWWTTWTSWKGITRSAQNGQCPTYLWHNYKQPASVTSYFSYFIHRDVSESASVTSSDVRETGVRVQGSETAIDRRQNIHQVPTFRSRSSGSWRRVVLR